MNVSSTQAGQTAAPSGNYRGQILEMARSLDRIGRRADQFLSQQLKQLQIAVEDLDREKSAWRRQQQREMMQLQKQREELIRLRPLSGQAIGIAAPASVQQLPEAIPGNMDPASGTAPLSPEQAASESGANPIRILLQPGSANAGQIGMLLLEFSKLNRESGGGGVRFEIAESRLLRTKWYGKTAPGVVVELEGFSSLPLTDNAWQGVLEIDTSEYLDSWVAFKTQIVQSSLTNRELEMSYCEALVAPRHLESRALILEASFRAAEAAAVTSDHQYTRPTLRDGRRIDAAWLQVARLKHCVDCLVSECGLRIHATLL